ncbi:hypothetical protein JXA05_02255 [Candidatus Peregrinibacteria bacterium]|nr:hypothetical protein [Candidatus Peregrinibacteria bacterium]
MKIKSLFINSAKPLLGSLPVLLGIILLIGLLNSANLFPLLSRLFTADGLFNPLIGAALGSIMAGNPVTSYVIGGELLGQGIGLTAVTAFMVAWVTVGIVQFPAEAFLLGKRFALWRNALSFILSILVAVITVWFL